MQKFAAIAVAAACSCLMLSQQVFGQAPAPVRPRAGKVQIFKEADLKIGMKGYAWTVLQGSVPEPLPIEILGIYKNQWGPKQDIILAKMGGKPPDATFELVGGSIPAEAAPREADLLGVRAADGMESSNSFTSSISSIGVMPHRASGENVLNRSAMAPTNLPSMYTGLPLMPAATLVRWPLPPSLARITSCLGPH